MPSEEFDQLKEENAKLRAELDDIRTSRLQKRKAGWWLTRKVGGAFAGSWLRNSFLKLYHEIPEQKVQKETLADVSASLLWRITRIGIITILLALLPTGILLFQTNILLRQNRILQKQNIRLDQQTNLQEAERRSSLVFVMSSLMDQMDSEINRENGYLSDALIARVAALTQSLKPYRFLENDELTESAWSPEKGQLFLSIILSDINRNSRAELFKKANFTFSDLKGAEINLSRIAEARLSNARLDGTRLFNCDWDAVDLSFSDLNNSWLEGSEFTDCILTRASAQNAALFDVAATKCEMTAIEFSGSILNQVVFSDCQIAHADLSGTLIAGCTFSGTTDLSQVNFENTWVDHPDWIQRLEEAGVVGADVVATRFKVGNSDNPGRVFGQHPQYSRFEARNKDKEFYLISKK